MHVRARVQNNFLLILIKAFNLCKMRGRIQATGDGRQKMADRRWETGDRRKEMGNRRWEIGDGRQKMGDRK
jgi:hypothetical protein